MNPLNEYHMQQTRRAFLERGTLGLGGIALGSLLNAAPVRGDRNADASRPQACDGGTEVPDPTR